MLLETFILAVIIGFILKGSLKNLAQTPLRGALFIWAGLILRYIPNLFRFPILKNYADMVTPYAPILFVVSFALLLTGVVMNISRWPMIVILAGVMMNTIAVLANNGFMPVSGEGLAKAGYDMSKIISAQLDMNHILITAQTRFSFLADIIPVPKPYPFPQMLSIGDLMMCLGLLFFIVIGMKQGAGSFVLKGQEKRIKTEDDETKNDESK